MIGPILARREAAGFRLAAAPTGLGTGLGAAALNDLLELVQHTLWSRAGVTLLEQHQSDWNRFAIPGS